MFILLDAPLFVYNGLLWIQADGNYTNEKNFVGQGDIQNLIGGPATFSNICTREAIALTRVNDQTIHHRH